MTQRVVATIGTGYSVYLCPASLSRFFLAVYSPSDFANWAMKGEAVSPTCLEHARRGNGQVAGLLCVPDGMVAVQVIDNGKKKRAYLLDGNNVLLYLAGQKIEIGQASNLLSRPCAR